jgi:hypothetical protein
MDSVSPVLTELEVPTEQAIALDQEEYYPIIVARIRYLGVADFSSVVNVSLTRYRFTDAERALIAAGADLILGQPHHSGMMPISLQLAMPGEYPAQDQ